MYLRRFSLCLLIAVIAWTATGRAGAADELPASVDLRPNFARWKLDIRKQGKRPTCSVFATVSAMEYALARRLDRGVPLSVEYANWAANRVIHRDQDGHFFWEVIKGYETRGICREQRMPYAAEFQADRQPSEDAQADARKLRRHRLTFQWIRPYDGKTGLKDDDLAAIKAALAKGWPVAAGSYHSILLVGYEDDPKLDGGGQFFVRDSGDRNEQTLSYAATKARMCDLFWVQSQPKPDDL